MRCQTKQAGIAGRKVLQILVLIALIAILGASLAACADKSTTEQQEQGGVAPPAAPGTISDVFGKNVDVSALRNTIRNLVRDKILSSIEGAEDLETVASRTLVVKTADGASHLFDINAGFSEDGKAFLEDIEEEIYAIAGLAAGETVSPAQEAATAKALKDAAEDYVAGADELIKSTPFSLTELAQIDPSLSLNTQVHEFGEFEKVVFSEMTESMPFTAEGEFSSENCTMNYAFGIKPDGSVTVFVVTYAEGGETDQEKIDNMAEAGAAILSKVGTFPAGVVFELPPLEQPGATISAEELYNQVFGEDYKFTKFEEFFQKLMGNVLMGNVLSNVSSYKVLAIDLSPERFAIYSDAVLKQGRTVLAVSIYNGEQSKEISEYYNFSSQLGDLSFKNYIYSLIRSTDNPVKEEQQILLELKKIKEKSDKYMLVKDLTTSNQFITDTPIMNTTTEIDFSVFAEKFIPEGTQPVLCYVDSFGARNMESSDRPYFGVGYINQCDIMFGYVNEDGDLVLTDALLVVPQYLDSTNESMYAGILNKTEGVGYKIADSSTTVVKNPILTGNTSGIEPANETEPGI